MHGYGRLHIGRTIMQGQGGSSTDRNVYSKTKMRSGLPTGMIYGTGTFAYCRGQLHVGPCFTALYAAEFILCN